MDQAPNRPEQRGDADGGACRPRRPPGTATTRTPRAGGARRAATDSLRLEKRRRRFRERVGIGISALLVGAMTLVFYLVCCAERPLALSAQRVGQRAERGRPVREPVLLVERQLRHRAPERRDQEQRIVAEAQLAPAAASRISPSQAPLRASSTPARRVDEGGDAAEARAPARRRDVAQRLQQLGVVAGVVGRQARRSAPNRRPGAPSSASTSSPESSAMAGRPVARRGLARLGERVVLERGAVLAQLAVGRDARRWSRARGPAPRAAGRSRAACRGCGSRRRPSTAARAPAPRAGGRTASASPAAASATSAAYCSAENAPFSAVAWTSTNRPSPVITKLQSTSACESSTYGRSTRASPSMMPAEIAATGEPHADRPAILPACTSRRTASASATQPPVIAAVRVPPSAWMTSQSTVIWRGPERAHVDGGAQRAADQPLDLLPAAAGGAPRTRVRRARQHRVLGGHPALALALRGTAAPSPRRRPCR